MIWSRFGHPMSSVYKSSRKGKKEAKKTFFSVVFYKEKNSKLGSIIKSVIIAWARNGHVLVTVLIFELLIY